MLKFKTFVSKRYYLLISLVLLSLIAVATLAWIKYLAHKTIEQTKFDNESRTSIDVLVTKLELSPMNGVISWFKATEVRTFVNFKGELYAATTGGLIRYDISGKVIKHYTSNDGLPDNDITTLAVFQDQLYIGTYSSGLLSFDGTTFTQYTFRKPQATHISALCTNSSYLLVGTFDSGLFDFDGNAFGQRFQPIKTPQIKAITSITSDTSRIYVGTQNSGLYVWKEGQLNNYSTSNGLHSPHVTAIVKSDSDMFVSTDVGIVKFTENLTIETISNQPNITSLIATEDKLLAGLMTGGIIEIPKVKSAATKFSQRLPAIHNHENITITNTAGDIWALTPNGILKAIKQENKNNIDWIDWGIKTSFKNQLTNSHITSLAFDSKSLWIGYFDKGIDIFSIENQEVTQHLQNEVIREINFLKPIPESQQMGVATSLGLALYDSSLHVKYYNEKNANLISNNIAHIAYVNHNLVSASNSSKLPMTTNVPMILATARGLTYMQSGVSRSLTAFHGLASNYLYCTAFSADKLYVGSLGGLMEFEGLRVKRIWKIDNSRLKANWITSLLPFNGSIYIGTYGGGISVLLPNGEISTFEETSKLEINTNAIATDGKYLYAGTLDQGLLIYDPQHNTWNKMRKGLASQNVTSIAIQGNFLYCGTSAGLTRIDINLLH